MSAKKQEDSPFEHLIGRTGQVTDWDELTQLAIVRIGSEQWSARSDQPLQVGDSIEVIAGASTVLTVKLKV